jgi:hypothetical protein
MMGLSNGVNPFFQIEITKESIIEKTHCCENLPLPLSVSSRTDFSKEGYKGTFVLLEPITEKV